MRTKPKPLDAEAVVVAGGGGGDGGGEGGKQKQAAVVVAATSDGRACFVDRGGEKGEEALHHHQVEGDLDGAGARHSPSFLAGRLAHQIASASDLMRSDMETTESEYLKQKRLLEDLHLRLEEAGQKITDREKLRIKLHNTILVMLFLKLFLTLRCCF
ncbi:hypothetical protein ABZP36_030876 [Zizania latifolia]